jgi:lysozyme
MKTSPNGKQRIKTSEGFAPKVMNDNGSPAIGYGHRLRPNESYPNGITEPQASALLDQDLEIRYEPLVNARIPKGCTQNQFDALCSFVYNVRNQPSSLEQLLSHGWEQVADQLPRWCHEFDPHTRTYVVVPGLLARRQQEAALFKS